MGSGRGRGRRGDVVDLSDFGTILVTDCMTDHDQASMYKHRRTSWLNLALTILGMTPEQGIMRCQL
jgi:hypothetical protein